MANKNYLSKISKNGETIYVKDEEARDAIEALNPASAASIETCEAIVDELV